MLKLYVFLREDWRHSWKRNLPKAITTKHFLWDQVVPEPPCIQAWKNRLEKSNFLLALFLGCLVGFYFCQLSKPGYWVRLLLVLSCCCFYVLKHLSNDIQECKTEKIIVASFYRIMANAWVVQLSSQYYSVSVSQKSTGLSVVLIDRSVKSFTVAKGANPNLSTLFPLLYYVKGGQHHLLFFFFEGVKYYSI